MCLSALSVLRTLVSLACLLGFVQANAIKDECGNDTVDLLQRQNPDIMKLLARLEEKMDSLDKKMDGLETQMDARDGASPQAPMPNVSTPGMRRNNAFFQGCRVRSSTKLAANQVAHKDESKRGHHSENLTHTRITGALRSCSLSQILLTNYGATDFTTSCCAESGLHCAGCAKAAADGQSCLECAGGFLKRDGKCISCADSAGWLNVDGKTCAQLVSGDCNDVKSRGKSSNEACCTCGGGIVSPTPFVYPSVHLAIGSEVHVAPSARTASRYSLHEDCELPDQGITMSGTTGVVTASAARPDTGPFSIECAVTAHQALGVSYDTTLRIGMDYLSYGAPVLFFSGSATKAAQKAPGLWKDFSIMCAPTVNWLQVDTATGDLSRSAADANNNGAVDTEDTTTSGQNGGICVMKAQHAAPRVEYAQGMMCNYCRTCSSCSVTNAYASALRDYWWYDNFTAPDIHFLNNFSGIPLGTLFCIRCAGYLHITLRGYYNLYLRTRDGSRVYLDGQLMTQKTGCGAADVEKENIWLEAGYHDLEVLMCNGGGNQFLQLAYYGPDTDHIILPVPSSALFHDAFTERQARFVALALQPWTALTYKTTAVSVTLGEQLPLLNLEEPTQQGLLKPSFFKVSCSSTPTLKYDFDDLLSTGLVEGYPVLEVTPEGSISVLPARGLSSVFDSQPSTGADRKRISLACSVWGAFPDLAGLDPIKASLTLTLLDDICWVNKLFFANAFTLIDDVSSEASCRAACRESASCAGYLWSTNQCQRRHRLAAAGESATAAWAKVTDCRAESACMEVADAAWYKAGNYCPVSPDLARDSMLYRKEGTTAEETLHLAKYSRALDGALSVADISDGDWILRQADPKTDFIDTEVGEVALRGTVLGKVLEAKVSFAVAPCAVPANLTAAAEEAEEQEESQGRSPFIVDNPFTDPPADYTLHPCECAPSAWGMQKPVIAAAVQSIPPESGNIFVPPPFHLASGQMLCPPAQLISVHIETEKEAVGRTDCEARCKATSSCVFYFQGEQSEALICRIYSGCTHLVQEPGVLGDLFAVSSEQRCHVADPGGCFSMTARRAYLTSAMSSKPFAYWDLHVLCDVFLILGGGGAQFCARPTYRDPTNHAWQHKTLLPETFAHGTMLSLSCWDERYRGFYDDSAASVDSLSCVNGQWFNSHDEVGLGKFRCHQCVQIGTPAYKQVYDLNLQEAWFLSRLQLALFTEPTTKAHCLELGERFTETEGTLAPTATEDLCPTNVLVELGSTPFSDSRKVKLLEGNNQCMQQDLAGDSPFPVHRECAARESQQIPMSDMGNLLWNLHTQHLLKAFPVFAPSIIDCNGFGAVSEVDLRDLFSDHTEVTAYLGSVDLDVELQFAQGEQTDGAANWKRLMTKNVVVGPVYDKAEVMRMCVSYTTSVPFTDKEDDEEWWEAEPLGGFGLEFLTRSPRDDEADFKDYITGTRLDDRLVQNRCGAWHPKFNCSSTGLSSGQGCEAFVRHTEDDTAVRINSARWEYATQGTSTLARSFRGQIATAGYFSSDDGSLGAWQKFNNETNHSGIAIESSVYSGLATHFRQCVLYTARHPGNNFFNEPTVRLQKRSGLVLDYQHFATTDGTRRFDCGTWTNISKLDCQIDDACDVEISNPGAATVYRHYLQFGDFGLSEPANVMIMGSKQIPLSRSLTTRAPQELTMSSGDWHNFFPVNWMQGYNLESDIKHNTNQFRLCVTASQEGNSPGILRFRLRLARRLEANFTARLSFEDEFSIQSGADYRTMCGPWRDTEHLAGTAWDRAHQFELQQVGIQNLRLQEIQLQLAATVNPNVCRFAPVTFNSVSQRGANMTDRNARSGSWPNWHERLAAAPVSCPPGQVLTSLFANASNDQSMTYTCGHTPGLGACVEWYTPQVEIPAWNDTFGYRNLYNTPIQCKADASLNAFSFEFSDGGKWARFRYSCCKVGGVPMAWTLGQSPENADAMVCPVEKDDSGRLVYEPLQDQTDATTCSSSDVGRGWVLVRRTQSGSFAANDNLAGTVVSGTAHHNPTGSSFSRKFDATDFGQFLFATGDCAKWMIMEKEQAIGENYVAQKRRIVKSSQSSTSYMAEMYFRANFPEDPVLSFGDHTADWATVLYAEGGNPPLSNTNQGLNVFIHLSGAAVLADRNPFSLSQVNLNHAAGQTSRKVTSRASTSQQLRFNLNTGSWCLDSDCADVNAKLVPNDLSGSNWVAVVVTDLTGVYEGGGIPKNELGGPSGAKTRLPIESPQRPPQPPIPKLQGFVPEEPTYATECVDYSELWKNIQETYTDVSGEVKAHTNKLKAEPAQELPETSPCEVAAGVSAIRGKFGGGDGGTTPEKMGYEELDACHSRADLRGVNLAQAELGFTASQTLIDSVKSIAHLICSAIPDPEAAPLGVGLQVKAEDICHFGTDAKLGVMETGLEMGNLGHSLEVAKEDAVDCSPQSSFDRLFCDIHCVRDAVLRGDRAILRNLKTATDVTNNNMKKLAEWSVEANKAETGWVADKIDVTEARLTQRMEQLQATMDAATAGANLNEVKASSARMVSELYGFVEAASSNTLSRHTARDALERFVAGSTKLEGPVNISHAAVALRQLSDLHSTLRNAGSSGTRLAALGNELQAEVAALQDHTRQELHLLGMYKEHSNQSKVTVRTWRKQIQLQEEHAQIITLDRIWWELRGTLDEYMEVAETQVSAMQSAIQSIANYEQCASGLQEVQRAYAESLVARDRGNAALRAAWRQGSRLLGELASVIVDGEVFSTFAALISALAKELLSGGVLMGSALQDVQESFRDFGSLC